MKTLEKDELYQNLQEFLKTKGVELKEGSYSRKVQKSCSLLSDTINASQKGLARAKGEIDKKLDQLRQVIHEKTAPHASTASSKSEAPPAQSASEGAAPKDTKRRKQSSPRKRRS